MNTPHLNKQLPLSFPFPNSYLIASILSLPNYFHPTPLCLPFIARFFLPPAPLSVSPSPPSTTVTTVLPFYLLFFNPSLLTFLPLYSCPQMFSPSAGFPSPSFPTHLISPCWFLLESRWAN
jgi:hypothetical protein